MHASSSHHEPWGTSPAGPWKQWRGYFVRWILFGVVVQLFQPVAAGAEPFWSQKLYQALSGLLFGVACATVFTRLENRFNAARIAWKTWSLVVVTWLLVKVVFVSVLALSGNAH